MPVFVFTGTLGSVLTELSLLKEACLEKVLISSLGKDDRGFKELTQKTELF